MHNGLTYKQFITNSTAVEGIVATRWHGWELVGLLENYHALDQGGTLNWFYGYGAHIGFYNPEYTEWDGSSSDYTVVGVDGILGIEYQFNNLPLAVSID